MATAQKRTANGGQVSTRRHVYRWCPFFRLGFRFLPHVPTTPRTSAPVKRQRLLGRPFLNTPSYTHHPIPAPLTNEYRCHRCHLQCVFCARSRSGSITHRLQYYLSVLSVLDPCSQYCERG